MKNRRSDLDWLRVTAFGLLILYHSGMAWSGWHWHLNSTADITWLREAMRFVNRWRMPLIFLVSGGAIVLTLGLRSPGAFAVDRLRRLLLPLAFGLIGDWHGLVYNGVLLLYGGFIFGTPDMLAVLNRQRWLSLGIGIACYATLYSSFFDGAVGALVLPADRPAYAVLSAVNTMAWLFTAIGFSNRHLTMRPRFLGSASAAVYPFYMIHQTLTVIAVYWLLTFEVPPADGVAPPR